MFNFFKKNIKKTNATSENLRALYEEIKIKTVLKI